MLIYETELDMKNKFCDYLKARLDSFWYNAYNEISLLNFNRLDGEHYYSTKYKLLGQRSNKPCLIRLYESSNQKPSFNLFNIDSLIHGNYIGKYMIDEYLSKRIYLNSMMKSLYVNYISSVFEDCIHEDDISLMTERYNSGSFNLVLPLFLIFIKDNRDLSHIFYRGLSEEEFFEVAREKLIFVLDTNVQEKLNKVERFDRFFAKFIKQFEGFQIRNEKYIYRYIVPFMKEEKVNLLLRHERENFRKKLVEY